jgi:hypothetical protein
MTSRGNSLIWIVIADLNRRQHCQTHCRVERKRLWPRLLRSWGGSICVEVVEKFAVLDKTFGQPDTVVLAERIKSRGPF